MLSKESLQKIDKAIAKYPPEHKPSAVMAALAVAQEEKGHLSAELMGYVAQYLDMPPVAVEQFPTRPPKPRRPLRKRSCGEG